MSSVFFFKQRHFSIVQKKTRHESGSQIALTWREVVTNEVNTIIITYEQKEALIVLKTRIVKNVIYVHKNKKSPRKKCTTVTFHGLNARGRFVDPRASPSQPRLRILNDHGRIGRIRAST